MKQLILQEGSGLNEILFEGDFFSASSWSKAEIAGNTAIPSPHHKPAQCQSQILLSCLILRGESLKNWILSVLVGRFFDKRKTSNLVWFERALAFFSIWDMKRKGSNFFSRPKGIFITDLLLSLLKEKLQRSHNYSPAGCQFLLLLSSMEQCFLIMWGVDINIAVLIRLLLTDIFPVQVCIADGFNGFLFWNPILHWVYFVSLFYLYHLSHNAGNFLRCFDLYIDTSLPNSS